MQQPVCRFLKLPQSSLRDASPLGDGAFSALPSRQKAPSQRELSPQATEGVFHACFFFGNTTGLCRYTATRYSAMKHHTTGSHRITAL